MSAPASPSMSMKDVAALVDLSWERFRKVWPTWVKHYRFPQPLERPTPGRRARFRWNEAQVKAWWAARQRGRVGVPEHGAANDTHQPAAVAHRVAAERLRLAANMQRSA